MNIVGKPAKLSPITLAGKKYSTPITANAITIKFQNVTCAAPSLSASQPLTWRISAPKKWTHPPEIERLYTELSFDEMTHFDSPENAAGGRHNCLIRLLLKPTNVANHASRATYTKYFGITRRNGSLMAFAN
jgi:hypothetical protein